MKNWIYDARLDSFHPPSTVVDIFRARAVIKNIKSLYNTAPNSFKKKLDEITRVPDAKYQASALEKLEKQILNVVENENYNTADGLIDILADIKSARGRLQVILTEKTAPKITGCLEIPDNIRPLCFRIWRKFHNPEEIKPLKKWLEDYFGTRKEQIAFLRKTNPKIRKAVVKFILQMELPNVIREWR